MPIPASLRAELAIDAAATAAGGCIHECYRIDSGGERRFLKLNLALHADAFAAEADGLRALRAAGISVPRPISSGICGQHAYLVLEYLDLTGTADFAALGRMLAAGHRRTGAQYGWHRDNYLGSTPQQNRASSDWGAFWLERRIRPQIERARANGFRLDLPRTGVLGRHAPAASLLHGDLWRGNAGFTARGPVLFDPAVYYGDREADLAMTELFGGFPREFYRAYQETWPLEEGYERRKHLYNLYHLLNHLNLFGRGYLAQVEAALGFLRLA